MVAHAKQQKVFFHWKFMESFTKVWPQILQLVLITQDAILTVNVRVPVYQYHSVKLVNLLQSFYFKYYCKKNQVQGPEWIKRIPAPWHLFKKDIFFPDSHPKNYTIFPDYVKNWYIFPWLWQKYSMKSGLFVSLLKRKTNS